MTSPHKEDSEQALRKIIVVDDDPTALLIISEMTKSLGFDTLCAESGEACLELLKDHPISLVLSDWEMPGMDGPTLLRTLRKQNYGRYLYLILVTGRDDKEDLIEGLNAGADDFINKPVNMEELRVRLRGAARVLDLQESLDDQNKKLKEAHSKIEEAFESVTADLRLAADMQFALLPKDLYLEGISANWLFKPASFIAGDIFDYFRLMGNQLVFYIVDVEGHGIPSALTSFAVNNQLNPSAQGMCSNNLRNASTPEEGVLRIIQDLNRQFTSSSLNSRYFTMVFGVMDLQSGKVTLTQAGHPPPLLYSAKQDKVIEVGDGGMPVGMFDNAVFQTTTFDIAPGDRLFIYSDGAIECEGADGDMYGTDRLSNALRSWSSVPIEKIDGVLDREFTGWNGGSQFDDDVSMVCLEFTGLPEDRTVDTNNAILQEQGKSEEPIELSMRERRSAKRPRPH